MKSKSILCSLVCLLLLAACPTPFIPNAPSENNQPIPDGYGKVRVSFGGEYAALNGARTVMPAMPLNFTLVYTFTKDGESTGVDLIPDAGGNFLLEAGTYTLEVTASIGVDKAASGVETVIVPLGAVVTVEILLEDSGVGNGTFTYDINLESPITGTLTLKKWPSGTPITVPLNSGVNANTTTPLSLPVGPYVMTVQVIDNATGKYSGTMESVQIKTNLTTAYTDAFTVAALNEPPPRVARIGTGTSAVYYETLKDAIDAANLAGGSTEIVLLQSITAPETGMTGGYTINSGSNITLTVEAANSCTITAAAGNFTLFSVNGSLALECPAAGTLTLDGGKESADLIRSGVRVNVSAEFTMNAQIVITGFSSSALGGGVYVNGGSFTMNDGEISGNTAGAGGGGVYVLGSAAQFTMKGGTIYGTDEPTTSLQNTAASGGAAFIQSGTAKYAGSYGTGPIGTTNNTLPAQSNVASISGSKYSTLEDAIAAAPTTTQAPGTDVDHPTEITVLSNITAASGYTIPADKHIKLIGSGQTITADTGNFALFTLSNVNSSLTLGDGTGTLTLSGASETAAANRRGVYISYPGAELIMNKNVTITGFNNNGSGDGGGGVYVSNGTFTMNGGTVSYNNATNGGGLSVASTGIVNMNDGTISGNTATVNGGGLHLFGEFTMSGGTIYGSQANAPSGYNTAVSGAAVYVGVLNGTAKYGGQYAIDYGTDPITTTNNTLPSISVSSGLFEYFWVDEHDDLVTTSGGTVTVARGETLTITANAPGYTIYHWDLNGYNTGQSGPAYDFSSTVPGDHIVGLFVWKDGNLYNTNITITVIP